jgi:hypothetical protein
MDSDKRKPKPIPNERLRYYRKMRFWSQSDLADQLYSMCSEGEESERGTISTNMVSRWVLSTYSLKGSILPSEKEEREERATRG